MSSSNGSNGNTSSPPEGGAGGTAPSQPFVRRVAETLRQSSRNLLGTVLRLGSAVALVLVGAIVLLVFGYRHWPDPWHWLQRGYDGQIIVNSPTVYTRQRLVNDRLSQTLWLQNQLRAAEGLDARQFRTIEVVHRSSEERSLRGGIDNNAPTASAPTSPQTARGPAPSAPNSGQMPPKKGDGAQSAEQSAGRESVLVEPTTIELFRAKNTFRNLLRTEMMQTQLDDRHDIRGNTVYRLAFDATILAGSRTDLLAVVAVALKHEHMPENEDHQLLYREDYRQLYQDWIRYMQSNIVNSVQSISTLLLSGNPELRVQLLLSQFLVGRVCEFMIDPRADRLWANVAVDRRCEPGAKENKSEADKRLAERNRRRAARVVENYIDAHIILLTEVAKATFKESLREVLEHDPADKKHKYAFDLARNLCRIDPRYSREGISILELGFNDNDLKLALRSTKRPGVYRRFRRAVWQTPGVQDTPHHVNCPQSVAPGERIAAGVQLYDTLFRLYTTGISEQKSKEIADFEAFVVILKEEQQKQSCPLDKVDRSLCVIQKLEEEVTRCFAVDFLRAHLNAFDRPTADKWERIGEFLDLGVVGRETKNCQLLVSGLSEKPVELLKFHLNKGTEAFAYGVSPKSLSQHISTASDIRDAFHMLSRFRFGPGDNSPPKLIEALSKRSDQIETILAHPIVVGFGSDWRPLQRLKSPPDSKLPDSVVVEGAGFGWVIAPRYRRDREAAQIDGQYDLAAVISVPSWWRSARLMVTTCWLTRAEFRTRARHQPDGEKKQEGNTIMVQPPNVDNLCAGKSTPVESMVRLPGMIQELSRKLGFEVIQEPYLQGDQDFQVLEIGQPGSLVLKGGRLWRSTEVTLGAQRADSIIVLPDMEGIIAFFECVEPQWPNPAAQQASQQQGSALIPTIVRVWTSEGNARTETVSLAWPDKIRALTYNTGAVPAGWQAPMAGIPPGPPVQGPNRSPVTSEKPLRQQGTPPATPGTAPPVPAPQAAPASTTIAQPPAQPSVPGPAVRSTPAADPAQASARLRDDMERIRVCPDKTKRPGP